MRPYVAQAAMLQARASLGRTMKMRADCASTTVARRSNWSTLWTVATMRNNACLYSISVLHA
jgi:hypothetical protein